MNLKQIIEYLAGVIVLIACVAIVLILIIFVK
jgi:hypothetical protein